MPHLAEQWHLFLSTPDIAILYRQIKTILLTAVTSPRRDTQQMPELWIPSIHVARDSRLPRPLLLFLRDENLRFRWNSNSIRILFDNARDNAVSTTTRGIHLFFFSSVITALELHSASIYPRTSLAPFHHLLALSIRTCQIYSPPYSSRPLFHLRGIKYPCAYNEKGRMHRAREERGRKRKRER